MTSATSDDPALTRSAALRARAGHMPLQLSASERERGAEDISGPGGPRKSLKRLNSDKEIQGKPSRFLGLSLCRLGPAWLNLDSAWIGLGPCIKRPPGARRLQRSAVFRNRKRWQS